MGHISLEEVFWMLGCLLTFSLAVLMHVKRLHKVTPWFCAWMDEVFLSSVLLFVFSSFRRQFYAAAFWTFGLIDIALQVGVTLELARIALKRGRTWIGAADQTLILCAILAFAAAAVLAWSAKPATATSTQFFYIRFELFSSALIFFLAVATFGLAYRSGAMWRTGELSRLLGFLAWSASAFLTDTMHVYWRMAEHFMYLESLLTISELSVLLYWLFVLPSSLNQQVRNVEYGLNTMPVHLSAASEG